MNPNLGNLSLKKLQSFLAVAKAKSFRGAAQTLNRSQPAISMQVSSLEKDLGVALFQRTTRSVTLTKEGALFFEHIEPAFVEISKGLSVFSVLARRSAHKIRISCAPTISSHLLSDVLHEFQDAHPDVEIEMHEAVLDSMQNDLLNNTVDFGIGPEFADDPRFTQTPIFVDEIVAVLATSKRLEITGPVPLARFIDIPLLVSGPATALWDTIRNAFSSVGLNPNVQYEVVHTESLIGMTRAGLGVTFMPRYVAEMSCDDDFVIYPIFSPKISRNISIISLTGGQQSNTIQRFHSLVMTNVPEALAAILHDKEPK